MKIIKIIRKIVAGSVLFLFSIHVAFSSPVCHPFDVKCRTLPSPLQQCPLSALHMKGSIEKNHHLSAILETPDHRIYQASVYEKIGQEKAQIIAITDQKITVQQGSRVFFVPLSLPLS